MEIVPALDLVKEAYKNSYSIPSFSVWNSETIYAVLRTASRMKAPVMLMASPTELMWHSPKQLFEMTKILGKDLDCRVSFHLDHGNSVELVKESIESGFTSVMLDYSSRSYKENVEGMKKVTAIARPLGITTEGEIGHVGKANANSHEGEGQSSLTDPVMAGQYCRETGIDMVAISIGNAHGSYQKLPCFDFALLEAINKNAGIPLVLHGGSGTPAEDIKKSISLGIAKINVATEFITAMTSAAVAKWQSPVWVPATIPSIMEAGEKVLEKWILMCGCDNKLFYARN